MNDLISRQAAIDALMPIYKSASLRNRNVFSTARKCMAAIEDLPSAQTEIIRCKDCKFGEQDEAGGWFCRSLGCQIGNEDGSGFCADAERRIDEE